MDTTDRRTRTARSGRALVVGIALALGAGAAGATALAAEPTPVVVVQIADGHLAAEQTTFAVGETYGFAPVNIGTHRHEMVIERRGEAAAQPLATADGPARVAPLAPGAAGMLTWRFDAPGAYQIACHAPGHGSSALVLPIDVVG